MSTVVIDRPTVEIASSILEELSSQVHEAGQVILHFLYNPNVENTLIRIWQTTFLYDCQSDHRSDLLYTENITLYPVWTECKANIQHHFTLIFSGLPNSCLMFDFEEHCLGLGGEFVVRNIMRNKTDIYYVKIE